MKTSSVFLVLTDISIMKSHDDYYIYIYIWFRERLFAADIWGPSLQGTTQESWCWMLSPLRWKISCFPLAKTSSSSSTNLTVNTAGTSCRHGWTLAWLSRYTYTCPQMVKVQKCKEYLVFSFKFMGGPPHLNKIGNTRNLKKGCIFQPGGGSLTIDQPLVHLS